jgi:uncharacterized phiE125 gp8 family phage protein
MSHTVVVTTPAVDQDLCTLDDVKLHLGITDTSKDALLSDLITRASAMIETYLGRTIAIQTYTETWRAPATYRRDSITLAYAPVTALTSVTETGMALTADTDYEFESNTGIIYRITDAPSTRLRFGYEVIVVYDSGWATVPSAIASVCIDLVTVAYTQGRHDTSVRLELTQGVGRVEYFDRGWSTFAFDDGMKCSLQPYVAITA